ncbi:phage minor capsid protein [Cellulosilyticum lentocellum]|uniref:Minor capsid 2 protein n=1 Tax=Cellulosilyticum lentocellum (strain ATCC 49066 / DSM 5427 / NCIMB 11756 / RHM5) TaxID=642492 RepID=F2JPK1_CELLD|nr:phage minor capsid protein [Cellulosilyticum lentocellum]ADZ82549.1 minor capsid 2 protein [Cellulosilyticum lentocellum DSM 5427]
MLAPSYLESLPVGIVDIYSDLESSIIADISRRIAGVDGKEFRMTGTAEWQIRKAMEMRLSQDEIAKQVARALGKSTKEVKQLFKNAGIKALESDAKIYALAGKDPTEFMNSIALNQTLQAGIKNTNGLMSNFCRTTANTSNKLFEDLLDRAYLEVNSGAFSYQQAIQRAIRTLGVQGLQTIRYPSGHTDQVDVAVRRAVVTGINQTCARLQLDLASEMDCDLVEVTSHFGARPSHADWQGGIYSISGKHRHYKGLAEATGYGSGDGLCGWNCRHNFYPFFEGISVPLGNPHDAKESEEYYNNTQKQRAYERRIRSTKRQVIALESAISIAKDNDLKSLLQKDFTAKSVKLKQQEQQLRDFIKESDLPLRNNRIKVSGFGKSQAQKATMAAKKEILGKTKELEKLKDLQPPMRERHYLQSINKHSSAKTDNTIIMPHINVDKDIEDIKKGLYTRVNEEYTVNGRTYKYHGNRLYPVKGDGFITLSRNEYKWLQKIKLEKDNPRLNEFLRGMGATDNDIKRLTNILKQGGVL